MNLRPKTCLILSLLILATHAHCVATHAAELIAKVEASTEATPIGGDSLPCGDEYGCLCKGAIVGGMSLAVLDQDDSFPWLSWNPLDASMPGFTVAVGLTENNRPIPLSALPFGGASARALLQSFQI